MKRFLSKWLSKTMLLLLAGGAVTAHSTIAFGGGLLQKSAKVTGGGSTGGSLAITAFSPTNKVVGEGSFTLSVTGANFAPGIVLFFDHARRSTALVSSSLLTATILASDLTNAGKCPVLVSNIGKKTASSAYPVAKAPTSLCVTSSVNPSAFGQPVTFSGMVSVLAPGSGMPSGKLTFYDGTNVLGTSSLTNGQANLASAGLWVTTHSITAVYNGDTNYQAGSCGSPLLQTVAPSLVPINTTSTISSSQNPTIFGQAVTFTATVNPSLAGAGTPSGTVTFLDGATILGSRTLNSGIAVITGSSLAIGSHSITAFYNGDSSFNTSTSPVLAQSVRQTTTSTAVSSSSNPSVSGQSVTFTATVNASAPGSGTPTGTVTFRDGTNTLGQGSLSSGQATFTTASLPVASHSITAFYSGDLDFITNASGPLTQTVHKAGSTTSLDSSLNPSLSGDPVIFSVTVMAVAPASGIPSGLVILKEGTNSLATNALSAGQVTFTNATLSVGTHSLFIAYGGDNSFNPSSSAILAQTVSAITNSVPLVALQSASTSPPELSIAKQSDGKIVLNISGAPSQSYLIQASTNLQQWNTITEMTADDQGNITFVDSDSTNNRAGFYRVRGQ
jgi:hypothetical protein